MAHRFRPWTTAQLYLLPPALNDWVDDDPRIHFVAVGDQHPDHTVIKHPMGFDRFSLRGLREVRREWNLVATCPNLLKLDRAGGIRGPIPT